MDLSDAFAVLVVSHLAGDFLLQTDRMALLKHGGLADSPEHRSALLWHVATYTLSFIPALVWVGIELGPLAAVLLAVLIFVPHLVQDDGRLLKWYVLKVKKTDVEPGTALWIWIDQSAHAVVLFLTALLLAAI